MKHRGLGDFNVKNKTNNTQNRLPCFIDRCVAFNTKLSIIVQLFFCEISQQNKYYVDEPFCITRKCEK